MQLESENMADDPLQTEIRDLLRAILIALSVGSINHPDVKESVRKDVRGRLQVLTGIPGQPET